MHISRAFLALLASAVMAPPALAQPFDGVGTRAAGMGGAFVGVADDASAVYWNPGGLASGAFVGVVLDRATRQSSPGGSSFGGSGSGTVFALSMPALGLSYYRLRATAVSPEAGGLRLDNLVTHHTGATLVQSVAPGLAVGATLKLVRGIAASELIPGIGRDDALDTAPDLIGRASNRFDADLGVMLTSGRVKAGLTIRNLLEPDFATPDGRDLSLDRQVRAGVSVTPAEGWIVAADAELLRARDAVGVERRFVAVGTERRVGPRAQLRAGGRLDTAGDGPGGSAATLSVGGSYAVFGALWLDGSATFGSRWGGRGWGLAARYAY